MAVRKITAGVRDNIRKFVDIIQSFLPMSSHSSKTITFQSIFSESGVSHYLEGHTKRQQLQKGWEAIFRYHKKLPFILIRKIVPAGILYRRFKRCPVKKNEIDSLIECLGTLNIDMARELAEIVIDESIPEITIPPEKLKERLDDHPLAPEISGEPAQLFKNGHYNESVRKAAEKYETKVQQLSGLSDYGKDLMAKVFKLNDPIIALNKLSTENEKGIQEGYHLMSMGMMRAIRNVFSHGDENQRSPEECFEMLLFLNWLFRQLPAL